MDNLIDKDKTAQLERIRASYVDACKIRPEMHNDFWSSERSRLSLLIHVLERDLSITHEQILVLRGCIKAALVYFGPMNEYQIREKLRARGHWYSNGLIAEQIRVCHADKLIQIATDFNVLTYKATP